jgi:hypothetical protein
VTGESDETTREKQTMKTDKLYALEKYVLDILELGYYFMFCDFDVVNLWASTLFNFAMKKETLGEHMWSSFGSAETLRLLVAYHFRYKTLNLDNHWKACIRLSTIRRTSSLFSG